MIGILLEVRYNQLISVKTVVGGIVGNQDLSPPIKQESKPQRHESIPNAGKKTMSLPKLKGQTESQSQASNKVN